MKKLFFNLNWSSQWIMRSTVWIFIVLLLVIPATCLSHADELKEKFYDDFENGVQTWKLDEGWQSVRIDNNSVLEGKGHTWVVLKKAGWDNYILSVKFKRISGNLHINYRRTVNDSIGLSRYFVALENNSLSLYKQQGDVFNYLDNAALALDSDWHQIEIRVYEGLVNVYIDSVLYLINEDENYLTFGGIAFETIEDSDYLLDEVRITEAAPDDVIDKPSAGQQNVAPNLYKPDVTHVGDLVLNGEEVMTIENQGYLQQGNVYINDNAKLIIRNSHFMLGRGDVPTIHVYINVAEKATLEIDNSTVIIETVGNQMSGLIVVRNSGTILMNDSPTSIHLLEMYDGARFTMTNSEMINGIGGLLQIAGGDTKIVNSTLGALGLSIPAEGECNISELKSGVYFESWDVHDIIPKADYDLVLEKTTILKDDLEPGPYERGWIFFADPDSHTKISNSEVRKVFIDIIGDTAVFDNLKIGIPSSMIYRDIELGDILMMGQWPFTIIDSDVTINNSNYLFLQPGGESNITLTNSHIVEFIPRNFHGMISFNNCTWTNAGEIIGGVSYHSIANDFSMKGSIAISSELKENLQWHDAQVTREYDVAITNQLGAPISGLTIKINGKTYVTDLSGKASFELVLDEYNYNQPEKMNVYNGNDLIAEEYIDFFTETPIRLTAKTTDD